MHGIRVKPPINHVFKMVKNLMWLIGGAYMDVTQRAGPQREIVNSVGVNLGEGPRESRSTEHAPQQLTIFVKIADAIFLF